MKRISVILGLVYVGSVVNTIHAQNSRRPFVQPEADDGADCICEESDSPCKCVLRVEHRLTMILEEEKELVYPSYGRLRIRGSNQYLTNEQKRRVITANGYGSRLVIAINGKFPGPRVEVFENQEIEITVINTFHTDSVTLHFHGIHQKNSPWMDGVAYVTQCPILPGQVFVYRFKAFPPGTSFYHAHIGDQRSMGLYGPFIVHKVGDVQLNEIIVSLQDWNHDMDAETAYQRMITEQFNLGTGTKIPTTSSIDGGQFSRFVFHSGLVNGKGRYWSDFQNHNRAPLELFKIKAGTWYRFRVIGAMTLYPMRVYIKGHKNLYLRSSDCFNLKNLSVQSIVIHPGERYDFDVLITRTDIKQFLFVAETIEVGTSQYHAAEAIIEIENGRGSLSLNPTNSRSDGCSSTSPCTVFNCPYFYSGSTVRTCLSFNNISNANLSAIPERVRGETVDGEYFFNFAFPGFPGYTPGSVNGREFVSPASPLLTQTKYFSTGCTETLCRNGTCKCTYIVEIPRDNLIQMTFTNIGNGSGWSHPIHLHGQSFYVMKMGFGSYDRRSGRLTNENTDILCTDKFKFCNESVWKYTSWSGGRIPGLNKAPPLKDTVIVPTGGYVVIRFFSSNPGMWFLHCHIDLHNTNGMGMVINSGPWDYPAPPVGFPRCGNFYNNGYDEQEINGYGRSLMNFGIWLLTSYIWMCYFL